MRTRTTGITTLPLGPGASPSSTGFPGPFDQLVQGELSQRSLCLLMPLRSLTVAKGMTSSTSHLTIKGCLTRISHCLFSSRSPAAGSSSTSTQESLSEMSQKHDVYIRDSNPTGLSDQTSVIAIRYPKSTPDVKDSEGS